MREKAIRGTKLAALANIELTERPVYGCGFEEALARASRGELPLADWNLSQQDCELAQIRLRLAIELAYGRKDQFVRTAPRGR